MPAGQASVPDNTDLLGLFTVEENWAGGLPDGRLILGSRFRGALHVGRHCAAAVWHGTAAAGRKPRSLRLFTVRVHSLASPAAAGVNPTERVQAQLAQVLEGQAQVQAQLARVLGGQAQLMAQQRNVYRRMRHSKYVGGDVMTRLTPLFNEQPGGATPVGALPPQGTFPATWGDIDKVRAGQCTCMHACARARRYRPAGHAAACPCLHLPMPCLALLPALPSPLRLWARAAGSGACAAGCSLCAYQAAYGTHPACALLSSPPCRSCAGGQAVGLQGLHKRLHGVRVARPGSRLLLAQQLRWSSPRPLLQHPAGRHALHGAHRHVHSLFFNLLIPAHAIVYFFQYFSSIPLPMCADRKTC